MRALPAESLVTATAAQNNPRQVHGAAYSWVKPTPVKAPQLIAVSRRVATMLDLTSADIASAEFADVFTGNKLLAGMQPYAMCYGGHQFGRWAGQLGDGRAINLGEVKTARYGHKIIQLKGAGRTPYSRTADGLAVLRSSIREFLCSEAMYHLGIPTTRALSLCLTGEKVPRDMFYDGRPQLEQGAIVCRVSSSFTRFGSFELPAFRNDIPLLKKLVDHTIATDFPDLLLNNNHCFNQTLYLKWFAEVAQRTCRLIVNWLRVGFVHGVMNTDNMSIIGETIDYGPYGWIDNFDANWTPNTTDLQERRYCFAAQGEIGQWNLFQLAKAIYPLIETAEPLNEILNQYAENYQQQWAQMTAEKLGLLHCKGDADLDLFIELENLFAQIETDMTLFYRQLAKLTLSAHTLTVEEWLPILSVSFYFPEQLSDTLQVKFSQWLNCYRQRALQDKLLPEQRSEKMNKVNPKFILRNYLAQQAIELAEQGDFSEIEKLQKILQNPYQEQVEFDQYAVKRPEWARHKAGCSMLSCSS